MADDKDYPSAILPYRPGHVAERFDALARRFGDPMVKLFILSASGSSEDTQRLSAAELLPYRYPRLRASELNVNAQGAGQVNIQINIGAPSPAPPIEVDPLG